jgi:hypothetical protein
MALSKRYTTAPKAGGIAAFLLVLLFGSPIYADWLQDNVTYETATGWWLRGLAWPRWSFSEDSTVENVVAADLKAILVVILAVVFLYLLPGSQLARARGTVSQFLAGWGAYVFAGALAALLTVWLQEDATMYRAFAVMVDGCTYGFFTGWIVGLAALGGRRGTR